MTSERFLSSAVQCIHTKESKARKEYNLEKKKKKGPSNNRMRKPEWRNGFSFSAKVNAA